MDVFPRTTITPSATCSSSERRAIDVKHLVDKDAARGETYATGVVAAVVESTQRNGSVFSTPRVHFEELRSFTRAEWERIKREVDESFDTFERTWPLDRDARWVDAGDGVSQIKP